MVLFSDSLPNAGGLEVYRHLLAGRATIVEAAKLNVGDSLNAVLQFAQEQRDKGGNQPISVWLGPQTYKAEAGDYSINGIEIEGVAGTQIKFTSAAPTILDLPSQAGYPTTRRVTSASLGPVIRADRSPTSKRFALRNVELLGHVGTAAVAGDYNGFTIVSDNVEISNVRVRHDLSQDYDATAGILSEFKGYSKRGFTSWTPIHIGEDRWIEPNTEFARPCNNIRVFNCDFAGEPMEETSGATACTYGVRMRKCLAVHWQNNTTGSFINGSEKLTTDLIFTGQPGNGNTIVIAPFDPYTRRQIAATYTFVSGTPANAFEVKIGATAAETARNLGLAINLNRVDSRGTAWAGAKFPEQVLDPAASALAFLRVEMLSLGEDVPTTQGRHVIAWNPTPGAQYLVSGTPTNVTIRTMNRGRRRVGSWSALLLQEDCCRSKIGDTHIGTDSFAWAPYVSIATQAHNDFDPYEWTEPHLTIGGWQGEGNFFVDAGFDIQGGAFLKYGNCEFGQTGAQPLGAKTPFVKLQRGTHRRWAVDLAGQPTDTNLVTITNDGHGTAKAFEFESAGGVGGGAASVTIGADTFATLRNLRKAIADQFDAHGVKCFASDPFAAVAATGSITFNANTDNGDTFTLNDGVNPAKTFEYDDGGGVGAGNVAILIGATKEDTAAAAITAINGAASLAITAAATTDAIIGLTNDALGSLGNVAITKTDADNDMTIVGMTGGLDRLYVTFVTWNKFTAATTITKSGSNITVTDDSRPYRCGYADIDMANHYHSTAALTVQPYVWAEFVYGHVHVRGSFNHCFPQSEAHVQQAASFVAISGVPDNNADVIVDSIGSGALGAATTFRFNTADLSGSDTATLKHINTTTNNTAALCATALMTQINAMALANGRSFGAIMVNATTIAVLDGAIGVNVALVAEANDAGNEIAITPVLVGGADVTVQGERAPIVFKDVCGWTVDVTGHPFSTGTYATPVAGAWAESYGPQTVGFDLAFASSMIPGPIQLVYAHKSGAGVTSKGTINADLKGPWGLGRQNKTKLYDIGGSMVDSDVIVAKGSVVNGVAVDG